MSEIVLASSSPRRKVLMEQIGLPYRILKPDIVEKPKSGESASEYVLRNAKEKAFAVRADEIIIAADTIVVLNRDILEKPKDKTHATEMLMALANQTHEVMTGLCLRRGEKCVVDLVRTSVTFKSLSSHEIARYVATGEPMDKAGSYAAQGSGAYFIRRIEGSYTNVVGLPMAEVCDHLVSFGIRL